jgi:hypothetical protein
VHLLVDSTGLELGGPGAWLTEKHGTKIRRSWRKLPLGVDAATGAITAAEPTTNDVDDGAQVGPLLDQVAGAAVAERHPEAAAVVVPPRSSAVPRETTATAPTRRDRHLELITEPGRMGWRKATGYNPRAKAEAAVSRDKPVIGDALRSHPDDRSSGHRDGPGGSCSEPHARARTPEVCPHRLNPDGS